MMTDERLLLVWDSRVRLLRNPVFLAHMAIAFVGGAAFVGFLVAGASGRLATASVATLAVLCVFGPIVALVLFVVDLGGGAPMTFRLTSGGIWCHQGHRADAAATATTVGGLLAGSPGTVGAGLLAKAEQDVFIAWDQVSRVTRWSRGTLILVGRHSGLKPIGLWGTAAMIEDALSVIRTCRPDLSVRVSRLPLR